MLIKQFLGNSITINRFDNGEQIVIEPDTVTEIDDLTGKFLISMKAFSINQETGEQESSIDIRQV